MRRISKIFPVFAPSAIVPIRSFPFAAGLPVSTGLDFLRRPPHWIGQTKEHRIFRYDNGSQNLTYATSSGFPDFRSAGWVVLPVLHRIARTRSCVRYVTAFGCDFLPLQQRIAKLSRGVSSVLQRIVEIRPYQALTLWQRIASTLSRNSSSGDAPDRDVVSADSSGTHRIAPPARVDRRGIPTHAAASSLQGIVQCYAHPSLPSYASDFRTPSYAFFHSAWASRNLA